MRGNRNYHECNLYWREAKQNVFIVFVRKSNFTEMAKSNNRNCDFKYLLKITQELLEEEDYEKLLFFYSMLHPLQGLHSRKKVMSGGYLCV